MSQVHNECGQKFNYLELKCLVVLIQSQCTDVTFSLLSQDNGNKFLGQTELND